MKTKLKIIGRIKSKDSSKHELHELEEDKFIYLDEKELLKQLSTPTKKQLDQFLFRNKKITTYKEGKKKLIGIYIINYLFWNYERKIEGLKGKIKELGKL